MLTEEAVFLLLLGALPAVTTRTSRPPRPRASQQVRGRLFLRPPEGGDQTLKEAETSLHPTTSLSGRTAPPDAAGTIDYCRSAASGTFNRFYSKDEASHL